MSPPFFVIRNSIHDHSDSYSINGFTEKSSSVKDDESSSSVHFHQTRVSLVGLVGEELKLDFDVLNNDALIDEFVEDANKTRVAYLDERNLGYLQSFATLIGKTDALGSVLVDDRCNLTASQNHTTSRCFTLLKQDAVDIICGVVSLERLFSWQLLVEARGRNDLTWRDIRAFLSAVRSEVPFITKDGILIAKDPIHLSFMQFVALARLVEYHLQLLPRVRCRVITIWPSAVDIEITSSHKCTVQIGVVLPNSRIPTSNDLQCENSMFVSWKSIGAEIGTQRMKIDSLVPNTNYHIFIRVDRQTAASSDDDVSKSRVEFITEFQANIFPAFESMSAEEQKTELLACINDKSIRKAAPVIPISEDFVSIETCSDDWIAFISWWAYNHENRTAFLTRELMHAASDHDIRRQAERNGISMRDRMSSDPQAREKWNTQFAAWYFGLEYRDKMLLCRAKDTTSTVDRSSLEIQHYDFKAIGGTVLADRPLSSRQQSFKNKVLRATLDTSDDDVHTEVRSDDNGTDEPCEATSGSDRIELLNANMNITTMQSQSNFTEARPKSAPLILPSSCMDTSTELASKDETKPLDIESNDCVSDQKTTSVVETGIVNIRTQHQRRRFLDKVTKKVQSARTQAELLSGGNRKLRGIALFRSKVRFLILIMKIQRVPTMSLDGMFDLFDFDENACDFGTLNKTQLPRQKPLRYDPGVARELRLRNDTNVMKRVFSALRVWRGMQMAGRHEMLAKTTKAQDAYTLSLLKRAFRTYHRSVLELVKERQANAQLISVSIEESQDIAEQEDAVKREFGIRRTPSFEKMQLSHENELASKFRENCCVRFGLDPTSFIVPHKQRTRVRNITNLDYNDKFRRGIELSATQNLTFYGSESIELFDQVSLKSMKHEKLKAHKNSGVNIFDVPADVIRLS